MILSFKKHPIVRVKNPSFLVLLRRSHYFKAIMSLSDFYFYKRCQNYITKLNARRVGETADQQKLIDNSIKKLKEKIDLLYKKYNISRKNSKIFVNGEPLNAIPLDEVFTKVDRFLETFDKQFKRKT